MVATIGGVAFTAVLNGMMFRVWAQELIAAFSRRLDVDAENLVCAAVSSVANEMRAAIEVVEVYADGDVWVRWSWPEGLHPTRVGNWYALVKSGGRL